MKKAATTLWGWFKAAAEFAAKVAGAVGRSYRYNYLAEMRRAEMKHIAYGGGRGTAKVTRGIGSCPA